jgi:ligand-binding SRPBCC domain-containing protein
MSTLRVAFESKIPTTPDELWNWSTSVEGIRTEMGPILKLYFRKGAIPVPQDQDSLGKVLGKCTFLLFGILPIDQSRLTFVEVEPGQRYVEQSQLLSMKRWRHERIIAPGADGTRVIDKLEFTPRFAGGLAKWFISRLWEHRHAVLKRQFRERRSAARTANPAYGGVGVLKADG